MKAKPKPYCTPAMLSALTDVKKGARCPAPMYWPLKSRGWIDRNGTITAKGLEYIGRNGVS